MNDENDVSWLAGKTIGAVIDDHARRAPDRPAILTETMGSMSYQSLVSHIAKTRDTFRNAGIGSAGRIGIALPSGAEAAIATIATAAHATCVLFHPDAPRDDIVRELDRLPLDAMILPESKTSAAWDVLQDSRTALFAVHPGEDSFDRFGVRCVRPGRSAAASIDDPEAGAEALVLRTSATTGLPKLVPVTHANMMEQARKMSRWIGVSATDRAACILPTYYAQGCQTGVLIPLLLGGSVVIPDAGRFDRRGDWLEYLAPTWFSAGPTFLLGLLDALERRGDKAPSHALRFVLSSSAHLPQPVREKVETTLGVPVLEFYGMTEGGMMAANPPPPMRRKPGTAGRAPAAELIVRNAEENDANPGEPGAIFIRGPSVMPGYITDGGPLRTGLQEGWLPTGDIGSIDEDGFLTIHGRLEEFINRGGEKISPLEVEAAMLKHPDVREAAAFALPHPRLGENVAMAVVLKQGASATASDLRRHIRPLLPSFKLPQRIEIVDTLPKGNTGKVLRRALREAVESRERRRAEPESPLEIQIAEIWKRILKTDKIGIDDDFFEAGGDSLIAEQMLLEVEAVVGYPFPVSTLSDASTIRALAQLALSHSGEKVELLTKVCDGPGKPFFFCHGYYSGHGLYALKLARLIDPPRPIYIIHTPAGVIHPPCDQEFKGDLSIETMAQLYVPLLLEAQPNGPFRIGGHCNGGLLAIEIAHQLEKLGRAVELVLMVETVSINSRWPFRLANRVVKGLRALGPSTRLGRWLGQEGMLTIWEGWHDFAQPEDEARGVTFVEKMRRVMQFPTRASRAEWDDLDVAYSRAMANYAAPKLRCAAVAIVAAERTSFPFMNPRFMSPGAWARRFRSVRWETVAGDHYGCVSAEAPTLAKCISSVLNDF
jgi:acyl-CoA synthetase (AMP-forming)/AMP-acid ligase II/thioesterase domain-containing protein/acyl carrier protein